MRATGNQGRVKMAKVITGKECPTETETAFAVEIDRLRRVNAELVGALRRAERDFIAICEDDRGKIDPAFALERVRAALAKAAP